MVRRARNEGMLRPILAFVGRFAGAWVAALAILAVVPAIESWTVSTTIASLCGLLHLFHTECIASGPYVKLGGVDLEIVGDCTSLMPTLALWSAVFAFPAPRVWKAIGIVAGAIVLWVYNLSRVIAVAVVLRSNPAWFEFVHAYLWQTVTLGTVLVLFVLWIRVRPAERIAS